MQSQGVPGIGEGHRNTTLQHTVPVGPVGYPRPHPEERDELTVQTW